MVQERRIRDLESRAVLESGLVRSDDSGKVDFTLALDGPMFERYARHMTEGAKKAGPRNWLLAHTEDDHDRFRRGLLRHVVAYLNGEEDEDHAAAIIFSLDGMEYVRMRQAEGEARPRYASVNLLKGWRRDETPDTPYTTPQPDERALSRAVADQILHGPSTPEVQRSSEYEPSGRWALQQGDDETMALVWIPSSLSESGS